MLVNQDYSWHFRLLSCDFEEKLAISMLLDITRRKCYLFVSIYLYEKEEC